MSHETPSYHILRSGIVVSCNGRVETVPTGDRRYNKLREAIREKRFDDFESILDDLKLSFGGHDGCTYDNGKVSIDGTELPSELNKYMISLAEDEMPVDRIVNFWRRLTRSGRYGTKQRLFAFLQHNGHPMTEDGRFLAYRRVVETTNERDPETGELKFPDLDEGARVLVDGHTKTINNNVGETPSMDPSEVDDDPTRTCSAGLHAANWEYAKGFYSDGVLVEVAIAPEDVITVPIDYDGQKMRTCRYQVLAEIEGPRKVLHVNLSDETPVGALHSEFDEEDDDDYPY